MIQDCFFVGYVISTYLYYKSREMSIKTDQPRYSISGFFFLRSENLSDFPVQDIQAVTERNGYSENHKNIERNILYIVNRSYRLIDHVVSEHINEDTVYQIKLKCELAEEAEYGISDPDLHGDKIIK